MIATIQGSAAPSESEAALRKKILGTLPVAKGDLPLDRGGWLEVVRPNCSSFSLHDTGAMAELGFFQGTRELLRDFHCNAARTGVAHRLLRPVAGTFSDLSRAFESK